MNSTRSVSVFLNQCFVGVLTQLFDGRSILTFDEGYRSASNRPILSLSYKNVLNGIEENAQKTFIGLPTFFRHLLPEGRLRHYLAQKAGVKETQEFRLLMALRDDLPGAVVLRPDGSDPDVANDSAANHTLIDQPLRFSLAGVQMKFSGDLREEKFAIPAKGVGGHWVIKLPSLSFPHVVELEYSMLLLAQKIGIDVPDFRFIPTSDIQNLPADVSGSFQGDSLISRRFDRTDSGTRIHMEDFAQVFAVGDKYDSTLNYQSIAYVIWQEVGLDGVLEYVRRLVHMVLMGNADMHLKNWSLVYPDGIHARLAPAYDLVSTVVYTEIDKSLPFKLSAIRNFQRIDLEAFRKLSAVAKLPERPVINTVIETVDALMQEWAESKNDLPLPKSYIESIDEHMEHIPLCARRLKPG